MSSNLTIKAIKISQTQPDDLIETIDVSDQSIENTPIEAWFDEDTGTIYFYTEADRIRLNEDSSVCMV